METPVEGERNDVRVELIEAEPVEFIPPEYSSGALYSRIGRSDKLDNDVVFCVYKGPSCHANTLTFSHRIAASSQVYLSPINPFSFSQVQSPPAAASSSLPAASLDEPARERDVIPVPSHHRTKSNTLRLYTLLSPTRPNRIRSCSSPIKVNSSLRTYQRKPDKVTAVVVEIVLRHFR
ncbi:hypothetical protein OUZ56_016956 [Daphnia magna]|uniref:Uncharacterized protein n=1 Tax=Daphnia magna TaxID=35525 RepID=A0ABR0ARU9_9CRUS|nr:hypothetical protein OUZ56_016956 [Daphnia magna]